MPVPSRGEDLSTRTRSIVSCRAAGTDAQVNAAPLEILDGSEQLLQRSPEAGDAKPVAGPGMIDQLAVTTRTSRAVEEYHTIATTDDRKQDGLDWPVTA